jgi:hypothetical protein
MGELGDPPHVPYLPELPGRGPGADLLGRGAALLVDLPVDLQPSGWRLVDHPGRDLSRAAGYLAQDLDALAEAADGYRGPLKVQAAGPWSLAASLLLPRLERAVSDPGACRDLVASLAEGLARHVATVARLVPGASVVLQLDEPSLPAVLAGRLPTSSGTGRVRAVEEPVVVAGVREVLAAAMDAGAVGTAVHCCAADVPVDLLVRAGPDALSVDVGQLGVPTWEAVARAVEGGIALWAGIVGIAADPLPPAAAAADAVWVPWRRLGMPAERLDAVLVTPSCGLAGTSPARAREVTVGVREAAQTLAERAEG